MKKFAVIPYDQWLRNHPMEQGTVQSQNNDLDRIENRADIDVTETPPATTVSPQNERDISKKKTGQKRTVGGEPHVKKRRHTVRQQRGKGRTIKHTTQPMLQPVNQQQHMTGVTHTSSSPAISEQHEQKVGIGSKFWLSP